jgi:hypothetical protein
MKLHLLVAMAFMTAAATLAGAILGANRISSGPGAVVMLLVVPHDRLAAARNSVLADPAVRLLNPGPVERLMIVHVDSMSRFRQSSRSGAIHVYLGMLRIQALGCT